LTKPFDLDTLEDTVTSLLGNFWMPRCRSTIALDEIKKPRNHRSPPSFLWIPDRRPGQPPESTLFSRLRRFYRSTPEWRLFTGRLFLHKDVSVGLRAEIYGEGLQSHHERGRKIYPKSTPSRKNGG
jgi:hypothetical protein